ncbi:PREDICTED: zinc finger protein-like 1 homolog [Rhagoletis zephyria]|uniref:zinc finger protein-like 1 homolog n=1 Tax=Rhagoletis zephyria TaxID=28612 RepID=UPI0008119325|nr:PREDICTED: zinc finger protein-like 1 homolog [Rhagoletis zephyria]XP_036323122.1 zinc finger protein-like 1 homolog [Rhagoletis pomonella]
MGLCKCPKRQVTNQFCFEHRVNVCENCMVQNHPKCVVQSYLQWLRDSDYVSNCTLCSTTLEQGECVRLICYHVFHWDCLDARQSSLPANTAPRGHQCPICETEIFPNSNLVSPVADALKAYLSQVNWGRNGLGLSLLPNDQSTTSAKVRAQVVSADAQIESVMTKVHHSSSMERSKANGVFSNQTTRHDHPHSVLLMDAFSPPSERDIHANSRRPMLPRQPPIGGHDRDENKYERRTPSENFSRWSRRFYAPSSRPPWRRTWFLVLSGVLAFLVLIYLMAHFGRGGDDNSLDDSWNAPNPQNLHYD